ncbi:MAG: type II toxin-antitoxin system RelE/ParE family toxin [Gammaproteobacteria bacterium]|nr:type II toxin-antitoxin system RelE/ParE family toxin [Gammaproteobacteria bacterium]
MPRVVITEGAARGLERCRQFLVENNPPAAQRAGQAIERQLALLETNADIGRLLGDDLNLRELIIGFGDSGYVALYRVEDSTVYVLAFRHQKEAGY